MKACDLIKFVETELNNNNQEKNAAAFQDETFIDAGNIRIEFYRDHYNQYKKLLIFCAENNGLIISTHAGNIVTIIRCEK